MADNTPAVKTYTVEYLAGSLIVGLILGVLASWLWLGSKPKDTSVESKAATNTEQTETTSSDTTVDSQENTEVSQDADMLVIKDQAAGLSVMVEKATVGENNWVVIHEDRMNQPGNALGAGRFIGGATSGSIELLRGTSAGQTYHGLIYKDDGDRIFSMERDTPLRDAAGDPIIVTFKAN